MIKRTIDLALSIFGLIICIVPMAVIAILIRLQMGAPILFRQMRPGLQGKPFELVKFRTMRDACISSGSGLSDAERLTRLGLFLRHTSLDELPELWNILKGDMSIVGPRPLLMEYLPLYSDLQMRRHEVRPGLTGWAQINGRNALSWDDKFRLDQWYIDNRNLWLDLKIMVITIAQVVRGKGVSQEGCATVEPFRGNN